MTPRALLALAAACAFATAAPLAGQTFVNPTLTATDGEPVRSNNTALSPLEPDSAPTPAPVDTGGVPAQGQPSAPKTYTEAEADRVLLWVAHAEWAKENPEEFRIALQRTIANPESAQARVQAKDSAFVAVELASTARNPLDARYAREIVPSETARSQIQMYQTRLSDRYEWAQAQSRGWPIIIFATGTATDALGKAGDASDDGQSAITTGSLGATIETDVSRWTARVSVISADAMAPADFGPLILTPGSGASLSSGVLDWRGLGPSGWLPNHIYGTASRIHLNGGTDTAPRAVRATIIGAGALYARDIFSGPLVESTNASLTVEFGAGLRWMSGDASQDSTFEPIFRDVRAFAGGPEAGFAFSFGRVTAAAQIYHLWNNGDDVPGLGGLQMVAGLSVTGEFLSAKLPHRDRRP
jgi:hypothetical protein